MASSLPKPVFVVVDPDQIVADNIALYESLTGKQLQPAQPERMLINTLSYREALLRAAINEAALANLVEFADDIHLDYLGQLLGVVRLPEESAKVTVEFTFIASHGAAQIPSGTRIASGDGLVQFATIDPVNILAPDTSVEILCEATVAGVAANGYIAGALTTLLDPLPFVDDVVSVDTTSGGHDQESDDQFRERIKLAPESFSVAGPSGAYEFFAKSADPSIIDVMVTQPVPGTVQIYPLCDNIIPTPSDILLAVENICSDTKVRPLSDTVIVTSPAASNYTIDVQLTLYTAADPVTTIQQITDALTAFVADRRASMGRDVLRSHVIQQSIIPGTVYDVAVVQPASDLIVGENEVGNCTAINVTVIGYNNG